MPSSELTYPEGGRHVSMICRHVWQVFISNKCMDTLFAIDRGVNKNSTKAHEQAKTGQNMLKMISISYCAVSAAFKF